MTKIKLEVLNLSHPNSIKTVVGVLTTLESTQRMKVKLRKMESLSLNLISGILIAIAFFSIAGCSDMPYTGSVLTTDIVDVDQYMVSPNEDLVCLQNGTGSECLTLIPKETKKADSINGPIIHIHPERLVYMFYHEGKEIVRLEKAVDTTEIVETLTETKEDLTPQTDAPSGDSVVHDADDTPPSDPLPQISDPPGDGTQPSDPPPQQPQEQPSSNPPPPPQEQPRSNDPPPPPPPQDPQPRTPPPPPQPTNQDSGNTGGDDEPDSTTRHHTPGAMYDGKGWLVSVYYPENYKKMPTKEDPGFTITSGSRTITIREIANISCYFIPRWPCNSLINPNNPRTYIARVFIETTDSAISVNVVWDRNDNNWEGDPPPPTYMTCSCDPPTGRIISASVK